MSDARVLTKYNIWCSTEGTYVETPGYHEEVPTVCPNNNAHTIIASKTVEIDHIDENKTIVVDDESGVGGYYRCEGINFDANTGVDAVTEYVFSFPYHVRAFSAHVNSSPDNVGDTISYCSAYNTDSGYIYPGSNLVTSDLSIGTNVIDVSPNFFLFVKNGFDIDIVEGVTRETLGECTKIDTTLNQITVSNPTTNSYTVSGGAKLIFSVPRFRNIEIANQGDLTLGSAKLGGSLAPPNLSQKITYINKNGQAKRVRLVAEITF